MERSIASSVEPLDGSTSATHILGMRRPPLSPIIRAIQSLTWEEIHAAESLRVTPHATPRHATGKIWSVSAEEILRPEPFFTANNERPPVLESCIRCSTPLQDWWPIGLCQLCRISDQRLRDRTAVLPEGRTLRRLAEAFPARPREPKAPRPRPEDFPPVRW